MGKFMLNGIAYTGTGTPVTANPTAAATDSLTKVKIENTVYNVGGGISFTTLVDETHGTRHQDYYILVDSIYNYDYIYILGYYNIGGEIIYRNMFLPSRCFDRYSMGSYHFTIDLLYNGGSYYTNFRMHDPQASGGSGMQIDYENDGGSRAAIDTVIGVNI